MSQLEEQILKQNVLEEHRKVHELQVRIKELRADVERYVAINAQQAERAEKAEAELARLREQTAVAQVEVTHGFHKRTTNWLKALPDGTHLLFTGPVPAPAVPDGDDFNGTTPHLILCMEALVRLDADGVLVPHGIGRDASKLLSAAANRLRKQPAPSVPEEWRKALQEAQDTFQRYADLHQAKGTHDGYEKAKANQKLANKLYAMLQSAEVKKMSTPPDMTHPKIQRLIAAKARAEIEIGIVERMLHSNGRYEVPGLECEYITSTHDILAETIRNARRYLALRERGVLMGLPFKMRLVSDDELDAAADRMLEGGK